MLDEDLDSPIASDVAGLERCAASAAQQVPGVIAPRNILWRMVGMSRRPKARVVRNRKGGWVIHMKVVAVYGHDLGELGKAVQAAVRKGFEDRGEPVAEIVVRIAGVKVPRAARSEVQEGKAT